MSKRVKILSGIYILLSLAAMFVVVDLIFNLTGNSILYYASASFATIVSLMMISGLIYHKSFILKLGIILSVCAIVCGTVYYVIIKYGFLSTVKDINALREMILRYEAWAAIIYIVLQFLQVTFVPIPSIALTAVGIAIFGIWYTLLYSFIGVMIGSMLAFAMGRCFGVKLVVWLCGESSYRRYMNISHGKEKLILFLMFLFPFFPDDLLCIISGLTDYSYRGFFITMLIVRPVGIFTNIGVVEGLLNIPFTLQSLPIWIAIVSVTLLLFLLLWKKGDALYSLIKKFSDKISRAFSKIVMMTKRQKQPR
ncbi:MAG: VTT domain-containing protein [Clostridia bacterium]|nr:VTT domain-containing protein [Clostridia bacterium]